MFVKSQLGQQRGIEEQYWFVSHKIGSTDHAAMSLIENEPHTILFLCYASKLKPIAKRYSVSDSKGNRILKLKFLECLSPSMADKHKGPPATFSLGRKFIHCWFIHILIPPCKHPWWTLGFLACPHSCGVPHTPADVTDPIPKGQHNCTTEFSVMVKSGTERQPLCHKQSCCSPV